MRTVRADQLAQSYKRLSLVGGLKGESLRKETLILMEEAVLWFVRAAAGDATDIRNSCGGDIRKSAYSSSNVTNARASWCISIIDAIVASSSSW